MRIVKIGTPNDPIKVKVGDLPTDGSLAHSFFKHAKFDGLDLSAFDLRDMDVIRGDFTKAAKLPPADSLEYIYSRNTEWPTAPGVLPDDIPTANHDMYGAWMDRMAKSLPQGSQERTFAERLQQTATGSYLQSWHNNYAALMTEFNFTEQEGFDYALQHVYANAPRLAARLKYHLDTGHIGSSVITPMNLTAVRIKGAPEDGPNTVDVATGGQIAGFEDRYLLARHLENLHPGIRFWVAWIDPLPFVFAQHERLPLEIGKEEWWFTSTPWPA